MRIAFVHALMLTVVLITVVPTVQACPFCHGKEGVNEVKAGIFNETFLPTLLAVVAPFPLFLGIAALIHFGNPFQRPVGNDEPHHDTREE
jgi:hypothetical protein